MPSSSRPTRGGSSWPPSSTSADEARIRVEDRGVGLEPQALKHLFQPFFTQFDPSRHSSGDFGFNKRGLGLGLSIAKQFVEMHGGRIVAESSRAGVRGSPSACPAAPAHPARSRPAPRTRPRLPPGGIGVTAGRRRPAAAAAAEPIPWSCWSFSRVVRCPQR